MLKRKNILCILSLMGCLAIPHTTYAKVDSYIIHKDNNFYEYNTKDLINSMHFDKQLYNQFQEQCQSYGIYGFHDDSGKIVTTTEATKFFLKDRKNFNLNSFIESSESHHTSIEKIYKVDNKNLQGDKNMDKNISIEQLKQQIKTPEELEKYFNTHSEFTTLLTPAGEFKFKNQIKVNRTPENFTSPAYDISVVTSWDNSISLHEIASCKICTKEQALKTEKMLKEYQQQIADITLALFPNKKISGGFYSEDKRQLVKHPYQNKYILFSAWGTYKMKNYVYYFTTKLDKFSFQPEMDNFWFNDYRYNLYER